MTKTNHDMIAVLLDRSGSMGSAWPDTVGGLKTFLTEQILPDRTTEASLTVFDDRIDNLDLIATLTPEKVKALAFPSPRGSTALYDAIGATVNRVGDHLAGRKEEDRPERVYFVIMTDGQENASREWTQARIKELITEQTEVWKWEFVFLGANQDAVLAASNIGIGVANAATYNTNNAVGTYSTVSGVVTRSRAGGQSIGFTDDEREAVL